MSILKKWKKFIKGSEDDRETEFLPAILEVTETPPSPVGRAVLWTIVVLLAAGLLWACVGSIDEVAVATGKVIPAGQVKTVQSKNKGVVKNIYVKEGDYVHAGDTLIELDPTSMGADLASLKKRAAYYKLDIERLEAQLAGKSFDPKPDGDLEDKDLSAQRDLYRSQVAQYRAERSAADMGIAQKSAAVNAGKADYEKYSGMLAFANDKVSRLEELVSQNAIAEFQLIDQQSQQVNLQKTLESQGDAITKAQAELAEAQQKSSNVDATYQKQIMTELVDARKQYYALEEEMKKADENSRLTTIVAPVDGRVNQLAVHTVGAIVTDAQALMSIVPDDTELELEVYADNKDIGFIKTGQKAQVKVQTFNFQKFGMVEGTVAEISPDAVEDEKNPEKDKKYRLILTMDKDKIKVGTGESELSPGMEVTAEIKIKSKKIIEFFMDPFRQYTSESLRER